MAENSDNSVFERVKAVIVEVLDVEESKITLNSNMRNDLGADSIDLMTLIVALEEEFDGQIADEEVQNLLTVGNTVDFIQDKIIKS